MLQELDPIYFIEKNFELNGKHFTLIDDKLENARHYIRGIYYTIAFTLPKIKKPMVIVKGRQVEMSTTMSNIIAYFTETYPYFKTLYVTPALEQMKKFSGEKISPLLRYKRNPDILKPLAKQEDIEGTFTVKMKQFSNGSTIYLESASDEGNRIRSISADMLIKDEYQDFDENAESNIDEVLSHSAWGLDIALGTPKYTETNFERKWKSSTQHYYHLQCPSCKHWFILKFDLLTTGFKVQCPNCRHEEDKRALIPYGKWIPLGNPNALYIGYHLSQLYVPWKSKEKLDQNIKEKQEAGINVEKYLKNEILGEFYAGISQKPPTEAIERAFKRDLPYNIIIPISRPVYAGVDWGGWSALDDDPTQCYTIYADGTLTENGILFVNYMEIIDMQDDIEKADRVAQLMEQRRVKLCVADSGYGKNQCLRLYSKFPTRFLRCKYLPGSSLTLIDTKSEIKSGLIKANIDYSLEELYSAMQQDKIHIARNQYTERFIEHFKNYEITLQETHNHVHKHFQKVRGKKNKVDAVHAINFLRLAALHDSNALEHSDLPVVGGESMRPKAYPLLTGHSLEEIKYRAQMGNPLGVLSRSIRRTMGE